jgi:type VI protein secretion system component VasF
MNAKKKRLGTKAQIRAEKERQRRIGTVIFTALILIAMLFSAYFGYSLLSQPQNQTLSQESSQPKAAIVDQLSLTFPNQKQQARRQYK